ncbi:MAG TPA: 4a-hydroxytetrahydrobiopterin dehydratase [Casimicrobiaceae bacterium]|nr:4a-hydroxytetrahydrobiopterin dehydratase [Casimicrobiaceae bacterium]
MTSRGFTTDDLASLDCRQGAALLSQAELKQRLSALPGWEHTAGQLRKTFGFADYYRTIGFVNALAWMANRQDHHPDLSLHYNRVVVAWSTHDAGGVTLSDCICAAKTDKLAS